MAALTLQLAESCSVAELLQQQQQQLQLQLQLDANGHFLSVWPFLKERKKSIQWNGSSAGSSAAFWPLLWRHKSN